MADETTTKEWLKVAKVAEDYDVSKMTVYRWAREGRIVAIRAGRSIRIKASSLKAMEAEASMTDAG